MKVLVIDVGGTNIKFLVSGHRRVRKVPSGPSMTPDAMVKAVLDAIRDCEHDAVSIGFPAPVRHGQIVQEPKNLAPGWVGFDFEAAFGRRVKVINDAAMQALGSYEGGHMLFLGLGTGLGSALILDNVMAPLELAHLPYRRGMTFEDFVGLRGLKRLGKKEWRHAVDDVVFRLQAALQVDYVVLGGGNVKKLKRLPAGSRAGSNDNAFVGGFRIWHLGKKLTEQSKRRDDDDTEKSGDRESAPRSAKGRS
jgi:predicted NBD/HSP70 family sugar kinase